MKLCECLLHISVIRKLTLCAGGRDFRGDPPIPLNGLESLPKDDIVKVFTSADHVVTDWHAVYELKAKQLDLEARAYLDVRKQQCASGENARAEEQDKIAALTLAPIASEDPAKHSSAPHITGRQAPL
jgi:hypothetical protein